MFVNRNTTNIENRCNWCHKTAAELTDRKIDQLLRCRKCKTTKYCGTDCQKKDWPSHKQVCVVAPVPNTPAETPNNKKNILKAEARDRINKVGATLGLPEMPEGGFGEQEKEALFGHLVALCHLADIGCSGLTSHTSY